MNVGDYVRTEKGIIGKITHIDKDLVRVDNDKIITWVSEHKEIVKISPNIIDLIEKGDLVNSKKVVKNCLEDGGNIILFEDGFCANNDEIKSIVTKEQFSQMEYKINK